MEYLFLANGMGYIWNGGVSVLLFSFYFEWSKLVKFFKETVLRFNDIMPGPKNESYLNFKGNYSFWREFDFFASFCEYPILIEIRNFSSWQSSHRKRHEVLIAIIICQFIRLRCSVELPPFSFLCLIRNKKNS